MTESLAVFDVSQYMEDGQGRLVHVDKVAEIDKTRDALVRHIVDNALEVRKRMVDFKGMAMAEIEAFVELSAMDYGVEVRGRKGNMTLYAFDMSYKIKIQMAESLVFDERLQVAKKLIDGCLLRWTQGSVAEVCTIIQDAFQVDKEGRINTRRILSLRRLDIKDPMWQRAMAAISDSVQVATTREYVRVYKRRENGAWEHIALDLAAI